MLGRKTVPSGLASLMVATVPLWAVVLSTLLPGGTRPAPRAIVGILCGLVGCLSWYSRKVGFDYPAGAAALLLASVSWAAGSVFSKRVKLPSSPVLSTAMQMLCGGSLLLLLGGLRGVVANRPAGGHAEIDSFGGLLDAVRFGDWLYRVLWLLRNTTAIVATSYAYVNPLVAVLLGWAYNGETPARTFVAGLMVILPWH